MKVGPDGRIPVWEERGWESRVEGGQTVFRGYYSILNRATQKYETYEGIIRPRQGRVEVFVIGPPSQIRQHPKAPCFVVVKGRFHRVDWYIPPRTVDEAILYVEKVLSEAVNGITSSRR